MEVAADEPDEQIVAENAEGGGNGEASNLGQGNLLFIAKRPIFIEQKAIDAAKTVGDRVVNEQGRCRLGGHEPEQAIENQQVEDSVKATHHAETDDLQEERAYVAKGRGPR